MRCILLLGAFAGIFLLAGCIGGNASASNQGARANFDLTKF